MAKCSVDGCSAKHSARGYCRLHYCRFMKNGDPLARRSPKGDAQAFLKAAIAYRGDECLIWPFGRDRDGYAKVWQAGKTRHASAVVCEAVNGMRPDGMQAAHSCGRGNVGCVTPRHLRWATPAENCADRDTHGTTARGERNAATRLSAADVIAIRSMTDRSQQEIADMFGISQIGVSVILRRKTWGHV